MKTLILLLMSCTVLFSLAGKEITITEGLWYISFPENSGEIKASETAYRFNPDGSAEMVLSERAVKLREKNRIAYKKRTGKDFPEPKFSWKIKDGKLYIYMTMEGLKSKKPAVFLSGKYPQIFLPENKETFTLLARKGAKMTPAQAKQFWKDVREASRDKFADNLKLPKNVKLSEPEKNLSYVHFHTRSHWREKPLGSFQQKVISAINKGPKLADDAKCSLPSLEKLLSKPENKKLLIHYFACHPEWRLYREPNKELYAVRYFRYPNGEIAPSLHQYYSHFLPWGENGKKVGDPALEFQFRFDISFGGEAWNTIPTNPRNQTEHRKNNIWTTRFFSRGALVTVFDQSQFPGRQMTAATLLEIEKEFSALLTNKKNWRKLLPADSCRKEKSDLILRDSIQGGIYEAILWCNPGERGTVYLKAFEITKGTPLSAARLKNSTNNVSGWSDDPLEQFCTGMYFTIYEGEWGQYYGARFEVWFKPDNGGAERKLFEKNYKIQGWQR